MFDGACVVLGVGVAMSVVAMVLGESVGVGDGDGDGRRRYDSANVVSQLLAPSPLALQGRGRGEGFCVPLCQGKPTTKSLTALSEGSSHFQTRCPH
jgi:hypothetical protein